MELSTFLKYRKGKSVRVQDQESNDLLPILTPEYLRKNEEPEVASPNGNVVVDDNEIILLWDGSNAGEFFRSKKGILASTMVVLDYDRERFNADYLFYSLKHIEPFLKAQTRGSGIPHVDRDVLFRQEILELDKQGQGKIAEVLLTVDRAIDQTETLIAKYQRIKRGLMQDLLTCGIDEQGQLRDPSTHKFKSSLLGTVPEDWEESTIGNISHRVTSGSRWWARYYSDTGAKFIRIGNLTREHVNLRLRNIQHVQPPDSSEAKRTVLETGDLLISVTADLGIIGIVPSGLGEAYINQHIALVKLDQEKINPYFIGNLLSGFGAQKYFSLLNDAGAKAGLNLKTISAFPVVFPSNREEQDKIAEIIRVTDDIIATLKSERKKLLGAKAGLMQDLLNCGVSVRPLLDQ